MDSLKAVNSTFEFFKNTIDNQFFLSLIYVSATVIVAYIFSLNHVKRLFFTSNHDDIVAHNFLLVGSWSINNYFFTTFN